MTERASTGVPSVVDAWAIAWSVVLAFPVAAIAMRIFGVRGLFIVAGALVVSYFFFSRRTRARRKVVTRPFPPAWREVLARYVAFYRALDEEGRARFEREVCWFVHEQHIVGPRGATVDDDLRILVAASAVMLTFGRPGYVWRGLRDIIVYSGRFDDEYRVGDHDANTLGMVHEQGPIVFSAEDLRRGFERYSDGHNVGLHEMAHVLDFEEHRAEGIPSLMPWNVIGPWLSLMHREMRRARDKRSVLSDYAATNEAEFFAVATEAFFERPRELSAKHPELYDLLCKTYGQDPARALRADPS